VMTQECVLAAGEDGRHPRPMPRQTTMADGVDTPVQRMQPTELEAVCDRPAADAERDELSPRDHAVLSAGDLRETALGVRGIAPSSVESVTFCMHAMHKVTRLRSSPSGPRVQQSGGVLMRSHPLGAVARVECDGSGHDLICSGRTERRHPAA
jgi:hypothetical protein